MNYIKQDEKRIILNTNDVLRSKCVLYEPDGGEIEVELREASAEYNAFSPIEINLKGIVRLQDSTTPKAPVRKNTLAVRKVVYNPPATIVLWEDGTRTVVKCDLRDDYDPAYGFALCVMKKALGNTSRALNDMIREGEEKCK